MTGVDFSKKAGRGLRIGINALYLLPGRVGGTETHIRNLVKWLANLDVLNEYFIFINSESAGVFEKIAPRMEVVPCRINAASRPARILFEQLILPFKVKRLKLDILLSTGMTAPLLCPAKSIVVIHDLQHVNQPDNFPWLHLQFLKSIIYLSAKSANALIAVSNCVKEDIVRHYGIPAERISVAYNAVDRLFFSEPDEKKLLGIRKKYGLPERFVLYIASSLPHKNYERLLGAFKILKGSDPSIRLVLIGARDYGHEAISRKIDALGLKGDVAFLGWLPFEDIPLIYSSAALFVFPSLHEGFGIPVIEAMASGVPVVCSGIGPLREVAGQAAFFVDPLDEADIARGMTEVLGDRALRERLVKEGRRRAADFSWEKTALDTLTALRSGQGKGS